MAETAVSESESARYSIHLIKSITWSACGNGQKKKEFLGKKKMDWIELGVIIIVAIVKQWNLEFHPLE